MLTIRNLSKSFGEQIIFKDLNLDFPSCGLIGIIGKSGGGKSTLLHLLSMLDNEYQGDIYFDNLNYKNITDKESFIFNNFSFVFQNYSLFNLMTVQDNILFKDKINKERIMKVNQLLKEVGLNCSLKKRVNLLSGGEKQRVAIARSLYMNPKVLFCDEPTGALDFKNKDNILQILKKISKDRLVIIVSHEVDLLKRYVDDIYEIENYNIIPREIEKSEFDKNKISSNNLSLSYMINYAKVHLKEKKYRSSIAIASLTSGLISLGLSIVLTSLVSNNVNQSLTSLMDTSNVILSNKNNLDDEFNETYACDKSVLDNIKSRYSHYINNVGSYYFADFENLFPNGNSFSLLGGRYEVIFGEINARSINNYQLLDNVKKENVYPYSFSSLNNDEVILKLREKDVKRICQSLNLTNNIESLSNYLRMEKLDFCFKFKNQSWVYEDEVFLNVVGFVMSDEIGIIHSSPIWNEYIFEDIMLFKSSNDLISIDVLPWTMKKIYYLQVENDKRLELMKLLLRDNNYKKIAFDYLHTSIYLNEFEKNAVGKNRIYAISQKNIGIPLNILENLNENFIESEIYHIPRIYTVVESLMMHAFTNATFVSTKEADLLKIEDEYSISEQNLNTTTLENNDCLIQGGISGIALEDNLKFSNQKNITNLFGRLTEEVNEIIISKRMANFLFPGLENEKVLNKNIYLSTILNAFNEKNLYHHDFSYGEMKIVGIDLNNSSTNSLYQEASWPIYFYGEYLSFPFSQLLITGEIIDTNLEVVDEEVLILLRKKYPQFEFSNAALFFSENVEKIMIYVQGGMIGFSLIIGISSILMISLILYLFIVENRREIGILKAIGISKNSIVKLFMVFAFVIGMLSYFSSNISLVVSVLLLSKLLTGKILSFSLNELLKALVCMFVFVELISLIIGYLISKKAIKYSPLDVLKEK